MKGIILDGGSNTLLHPLTLSVSRQTVPVYDKPVIDYPLSVLMLTGLREALVIPTPRDPLVFRRLFGGGTQLGTRVAYPKQPRPKGLG